MSLGMWWARGTSLHLEVSLRAPFQESFPQWVLPGCSLPVCSRRGLVLPGAGRGKMRQYNERGGWRVGRPLFCNPTLGHPEMTLPFYVVDVSRARALETFSDSPKSRTLTGTDVAGPVVGMRARPQSLLRACNVLFLFGKQQVGSFPTPDHRKWKRGVEELIKPDLGREKLERQEARQSLVLRPRLFLHTRFGLALGIPKSLSAYYSWQLPILCTPL